MNTLFQIAALDNSKRFGLMCSQCGSTKIYLLPARHAGNGLGRGYFLPCCIRGYPQSRGCLVANSGQGANAVEIAEEPADYRNGPTYD